MIIDGKEITHGLIIDKPWIDMILMGEKTWEMRSRMTKIRGKIALIKKGSGKIYGVCDLYDCITCDSDVLDEAVSDHCVADSNLLKKWNVAWKLRNVEQIKPIPYQHKQGAVIWVKL